MEGTSSGTKGRKGSWLDERLKDGWLAGWNDDCMNGLKESCMRDRRRERLGVLEEECVDRGME